MSHMHSIDGFANSAAHYQVYLERMRAGHASEEGKKVRKKSNPEAFRDILDPEEKQHDEPQDGAPEEQGENPPGEGPSTGGFGSHYA